jgi:tRNA threonylcarbamoyladenosine biosynthesis protein TsaE
MEIKTTLPAQTLKEASRIAATFKAGDIVALYGELGAGKTVFVKGLVKGLGIKARVSSPTYVFLKIYKGKKFTVNHIDLYRGDSITDFKDLGLDEIFGSDSITVIEWAQKLNGKLPKKRIDITIQKINEKTRKITVNKKG